MQLATASALLQSGQEGNEVGQSHGCHSEARGSSEHGLSVRVSYERVKHHLTLGVHEAGTPKGMK